MKIKIKLISNILIFIIVTFGILSIAGCGGGGGNSETDDSGSGSTQDTTAPERFNGLPTGVLPKGITETMVMFETGETATCRCSGTPGVDFEDMTPLTNTGASDHSTAVSGLSDGQSYSYYIKCQDENGNQNSDDFLINFEVSNTDISGNYNSECTGNGDCYDIRNDDDFNTVPWTSLASGDTVRIHYRHEPYRKIIGLRNVGTAEEPVKITGVKGSNGELPTISGENATPINGYLYDWGDDPGTNIGDFGVILVGRTSVAGDSWLHSAEHIIIQNLKIEGAHASNTYTPPGENPRNFVYGAAGIRVTNGDNITIRGCEITGNGNGIFLRGDHNSEDATITSNTLIEGNYIYHNGNSGRDREHNIYSQGINPVFQYNRIGKMKPGEPGSEPAGGTSLKDRSAGAVIRYNMIESGARTLDLVSAEDAYPVVEHPTYGTDYVYGNILINTIDENDDYVSARTITHFGEDNLANDDTGECMPDYGSGRYTCRSGPFERDGTMHNGTLYFFNNTVVIKDYRTEDNIYTQDMLFEVSTSGGTVEARNNIFHLYSPNGNPRLALMLRHGTINFNNSNWINSGWVEGHWRDWAGTVNEVSAFIEGNDPGFTDLESNDFTLTESSPAINRSGVLDSDITGAGHQLNLMYQVHQSGTIRVMNSTAMDLGAFECY